MCWVKRSEFSCMWSNGYCILLLLLLNRYIDALKEVVKSSHRKGSTSRVKKYNAYQHTWRHGHHFCNFKNVLRAFSKDSSSFFFVACSFLSVRLESRSEKTRLVCMNIERVSFKFNEESACGSSKIWSTEEY